MAAIDPDNPVVRLCAEGMTATDPDLARERFEQAWAARVDDLDATIAAHYLARVQADAQMTLHWNEVALAHADATCPECVRGLYPSLYLNLGRSCEDTGDRQRAARLYELAEASLDELDDDGYGALVRRGVSAARARMRGDAPAEPD